MQQHVSFECAKYLHKLGYDEYTEDLYNFSKNGIKVVLPTGESSTFMPGHLCQVDPRWGITHPSAHWIPAPFVFDVVTWLETQLGIVIVPYHQTVQTGWMYKIEIPKRLEFLQVFSDTTNVEKLVEDPEVYPTIEAMYKGAVERIARISYIQCWSTKIYNRFLSDK